VILDGATLDSGALPKFDICIVGAGAVGIAMAHRLRDTKKTIVVIDSGADPESLDDNRDWSKHPRWQDRNHLIRALDEGSPLAVVEKPFWYQARFDFITDSRARGYGGSTNSWGAHIRPLDEYDFDAWPITRAVLEKYYKDALALVRLDPDSFESFDLPEQWKFKVNKSISVLPKLEEAGLKSVVMQQQTDVSIINFQEQLGWIFEGDSTDFVLIKNATALKLHHFWHQSNSAWEIESIECESLSLSRNKFLVKADHYILAMGGLEVPRFMLINTAGSDWFNKLTDIGKYYMNHWKYWASASTTIRRDFWGPEAHNFYNDFVSLKPQNSNSGRRVHAHVVPTEDAIRNGLPWNRAKKIKNFQTAFHWSKRGQSWKQKIKKLRFAFDSHKEEGGWEFKSDLSFEQIPNANSTISLDWKNLDALGQPRLKLDWQFSKEDADTVNNSMEMVKRWLTQFEALKTSFSTVSWDDFDRHPTPPIDAAYYPYTGDHHLGTCRMNSKDGANDGVVNSQLQVLGGRNLWICSTAVFPSGGWANSTFTLLALALRLADHLVLSVIPLDTN
jgi:choline dehydrogenase-like flavoprotein